MHLFTSLDGLVSWLRAAMHYWKNYFVSTIWLAEGFIWYLRSARFMHAPTPSCSPFLWPVSKKIPTMFNVGFLMKKTQPKEWSCRFKFTYASVWPYPMFIECYSMTFQGFINLSKIVLYKVCIMCMIITDIKMKFFNNMSIFTGSFYMIDIFFSMSI